MSRQSQPRIRVVKIDDDPDIHDVLDLMLAKDERIEVVASGQNGREAMQLANHFRPDVMVLDVHMPIMSGLEAGIRIAKALPSIGLVFLTTDEELDTIKSAFLKAKAIGYLHKIREITQIAEAIHLADRKRSAGISPRGVGSFWTFYGPQGRAGTTSLAVGTAFELAEMGYRTLLVDLSFLHGGCSFHLRLDSSESAPENLFLHLPRMEEIQQSVLLSYTRKPPKAMGRQNLDLLFSPGVLVSDTLEYADKLRQCLDVWEEAYDYIILDLPSGQMFTEINVMSLEYSERLFLTSHLDLCGLKTLWDFIKLLRQVSFSPGRLTLLFCTLMSLHRTNYKKWMEVRHIEYGASHEVPTDVAACNAALTRGIPVVVNEPDSLLAGFARDLVIESLTFLPVAKEPEGLFSRIRDLFRR